jgi:membrane-associated phospholipid phosphatase
MLPWIQTRPPRALEPEPPWRSSVRAFNRRLLGTASIGVNTFPSGHAAEALAVALLVVDGPVSVAATMFVVAGSITAGAVLGRYHYAADALAGYLVALIVWMCV